MEDDGLAPCVGGVLGAAMEGAAVVEDDGAGGYWNWDWIREVEIAGVWDVMHRALGVVGNWKDAVFVGPRDVAHAAILDCSIVQSDPGGGEVIDRLNSEVALVLVEWLGLADIINA